MNTTAEDLNNEAGVNNQPPQEYYQPSNANHSNGQGSGHGENERTSAKTNAKVVKRKASAFSKVGMTIFQPEKESKELSLEEKTVQLLSELNLPAGYAEIATSVARLAGVQLSELLADMVSKALTPYAQSLKQFYQEKHKETDGEHLALN
jgi:ribosomal protein L12E/L44/L45/RPP1/RPP2